MHVQPRNPWGSHHHGRRGGLGEVHPAPPPLRAPAPPGGADGGDEGTRRHALGQEIRRLLLQPHASGEAWCAEAELLLFYADRAQHLHGVIRPALEAGKVVLCDRFEDSTRAYQGASGVPEYVLDRLHELVLQRLRPHLTLLLDMDPQVSLQRVEVRDLGYGGAFQETRFDEAQLGGFHQRVRNRFPWPSPRPKPQRVALIPPAARPRRWSTRSGSGWRPCCATPASRWADVRSRPPRPHRPAPAPPRPGRRREARAHPLFTGPDGIGKRRVALELAMRELCFRRTACGSCGGCLAFKSNPLPVELPNLLRIAPEGKAGLIRIGAIRGDDVVEGGVISWAALAPPPACHRLVLIEDAHRLHGPSANILLKVLEEPPPFTRFILVTHRPEAMLQTIRSRAEHPLRPLAPEEAWSIAEKAGWEAKDHGRWTALSEGTLRFLDEGDYARAVAQVAAWIALAKGAAFREAAAPCCRRRTPCWARVSSCARPWSCCCGSCCGSRPGPRRRAGGPGGLGRRSGGPWPPPEWR